MQKFCQPRPIESNHRSPISDDERPSNKRRIFDHQIEQFIVTDLAIP